ncbi:AP-2 complex subunit sigma [Euphorbia peplus]|nr:AP-2 complex subunit sigma [Euphorbia peplus]
MPNSGVCRSDSYFCRTAKSKYYDPLKDYEKHKVEYEVHQLVVNRDPKFTNFVEMETKIERRELKDVNAQSSFMAPAILQLFYCSKSSPLIQGVFLWKFISPVAFGYL